MKIVSRFVRSLYRLTEPGPLPIFVTQPLLDLVLHRIMRRRTGLFARMGARAGAVFLIDITDLPIFFVLKADPQHPVMEAWSRRHLPSHDARIKGAFSTMFRLLDGQLDGDAVFFSRELVITGDTEAVVCLANSLDDVDGSIGEDLLALIPPPLRHTVRRIGHLPT